MRCRWWLIALQGYFVCAFFLIADLLCATAVVPVLYGAVVAMTTNSGHRRLVWLGRRGAAFPVVDNWQA